MNILLIEDDRDDIELLEEAFRESSVKYKLHALLQGDKVFSWLEKCTELPHIIVMDLNMPKLHGKEILPLLNNDKRLKNIPVVVLTTSSSAKEKTFCLENGATAFMTKPTTIEGFKETVSLIVKCATGKNISGSEQNSIS